MDNYLSWNIQNWITVLLMVAIGMTVIGTIAAFVRQGLPNIGNT